MREKGAYTRSRKIKKSTELSRIVLAYPVLRKTLPELGHWAAEKGIADMSFISILERIQVLRKFLRWLVGVMILSFVVPDESGLAQAPVDATTFSLPVSKVRVTIPPRQRETWLRKSGGKGN